MRNTPSALSHVGPMDRLSMRGSEFPQRRISSQTQASISTCAIAKSPQQLIHWEKLLRASPLQPGVKPLEIKLR